MVESIELLKTAIMLTSLLDVNPPPLEDIHCLSLNMYYEARSETDLGRVGVSEVVLNRVEDKRFPNSICGVVKQARLSKWHKEVLKKDVPIKYKCHFSWYCDGKSDIPKNYKKWAESIVLSTYILLRPKTNITLGSTHYYAEYIPEPYWITDVEYKVSIDTHLYFKWN